MYRKHNPRISGQSTRKRSSRVPFNGCTTASPRASRSTSIPYHSANIRFVLSSRHSIQDAELLVWVVPGCTVISNISGWCNSEFDPTQTFIEDGRYWIFIQLPIAGSQGQRIYGKNIKVLYAPCVYIELLSNRHP